MPTYIKQKRSEEQRFGRRFLEWRKSVGKTQWRVCQETGMGIATISRIENGGIGLSLSRAVMLAEYAGKKLEWFLRED